MSALVHTPYDGSKTPFSIGLAPLVHDQWIEPEPRLAAYLTEKDRLFAERRNTVFAAEVDTEAAQAEVLAALLDHLDDRHEATHRKVVGAMEVGGRSVPLTGDAPLLIAARLVADDLVLMRRGETAWRMVAAALCFPSSWSLAEKFGRTLDEIHAPVPGYPAMSTRVSRIFDNLRLEHPVWRLNWSIYPDAELHHPEPKQLASDWFERPEAQAFIRVERQTLRRMPESGDILFTIKVLVDPIHAISRHPNALSLAAGLRAQLLALDEEQLAYKTLTHHRDAIAERLARIVAKADQ